MSRSFRECLRFDGRFRIPETVDEPTTPSRPSVGSLAVETPATPGADLLQFLLAAHNLSMPARGTMPNIFGGSPAAMTGFPSLAALTPRALIPGLHHTLHEDISKLKVRLALQLFVCMTGVSRRANRAISKSIATHRFARTARPRARRGTSDPGRRSRSSSRRIRICHLCRGSHLIPLSKATSARNSSCTCVSISVR